MRSCHSSFPILHCLLSNSFKQLGEEANPARNCISQSYRSHTCSRSATSGYFHVLCKEGAQNKTAAGHSSEDSHCTYSQRKSCRMLWQKVVNAVGHVLMSQNSCCGSLGGRFCRCLVGSQNQIWFIYFSKCSLSANWNYGPPRFVKQAQMEKTLWTWSYKITDEKSSAPFFLGWSTYKESKQLKARFHLLHRNAEEFFHMTISQAWSFKFPHGT